ncbi:MAG: proton-conducting transporter membrane subunit [Patescibacteria group bacterium]|jgi:hydrogenase-4 component F
MELALIFIPLLLATAIGLLIKRQRVIEWVSVVATVVAFTASLLVARQVAVRGVYAVGQFFSVDALGAIVMLIIAFVGLAVTAYAVFYLRTEMTHGIIGFRRVRQLYVLLSLFLVAMFLAATSSSPIFTWLSIEATTLATAFLISFYNKPTAMEAAWKYLIINSVGLLLAFFGTLLYLTVLEGSGGADFPTWSSLLANAAHLDPLIAKIAFVFALIGYGTKMGLAPMHTWLPDAHSKAPVPISALLSGVLLNVAFFAVIKCKGVTDLAVGPDFSQKLLIAFGVLTIGIAALIVVIQKNYKRLLAYSSMENMGILALGFGFGGLGIFAALLHTLYHALLKSAFFLTVGNVFLKYGTTKIHQVQGALRILPVTSVLLLIGFLAITGAPPFGIFFTKIYILSAGMQQHPFVSIIVLLFMAVLFYGFFKHITSMVFGTAPADMQPGQQSAWLTIPPLVLVVIALYLSLHLPAFLNTLVHAAAAKY